MATWWWYQHSADQVLRVVVAAAVAFYDVVGLDPVSAGAAFDGALTHVPPLDEASDRRGDHVGAVGVGDGTEPVGGDHPDLAAAEDLGQGVGSDPDPGRQGGSVLATVVGGEVGVDEHLGDGHRPGLVTGA